MNSSVNIILITGTSSSGKSTLGNMICLKSKAIKLNTKSLSILSSQEFSKKFFTSELDEAYKITKKKYSNLYDISLDLRKANNDALLDVWNKIKQKHKKYNLADFLKILYKNYYIEIKGNNFRDKTCIIDNNIFLDPFPERRDIFFKNFPWPQSNFKIINLYCNIHTILSNSFTRNDRFLQFIKSNSEKTNLEHNLLKKDIAKGSSYNTFRQPLRTIENIALLYEVNQIQNSNIIETIKTNDFLKLLKVVFFEQAKLIGFLLFNKYAFTHIVDNELIHLNKRFEHLTKINHKKPFVFIKEKRCSYDLQIVTDHNLNEQEINNNLNKTGNVYIKNKSESKIYLQDINRKFLNADKNEKYRLPHKKQNNCDQNKHLIDCFEEDNSKIFNLIVSDILNNKQNIEILFPVSKKHHTKIICKNLKKNTLNIDIIHKYKNRSFDTLDNNLIFLATLYSKLKIKGDFERLFFDYNLKI